MERLDRTTSLGALHVVGCGSEFVAAAAEIAVQRANPSSAGSAGTGIERVEIAGEAAVLKSSPMHGKSALRWGLKRALGGVRLPRVNEYENLRWLNARGFATPTPLAAGGIVRAGIPRWQFLVTRYVPDGVPLHDWLAGDPARDARAEVLDELAREVARMHALGFVHRDLWTRNLLVVPRGRPARVVFLDAWAGGPGFGLRGPAHDLRCFAQDMQRWWSADEAASWRERYEAVLRVSG